MASQIWVEVFLSIFSSAINKDNKMLTRQYISYGYLSMDKNLTIISLNFSLINFNYILYSLIGIFVYYPSQKIFNFIVYDVYVKIIGSIALLFGIFLLISLY